MITPRYPKCGVVDFAVYLVDNYENRRDYEIQARMDNRAIGDMDLSIRSVNGTTAAVVEYAKVLTPRCGIGTKLYERALQVACKNNAPLASDTSRTIASEQFWQKQVNKGRAYCLRSDKPAEKLEHSPAGFAPVGEWPCHRYIMREACPRKIDLSGRRRR